MTNPFWTQPQDEELKDSVFESNLSSRELADKFGVSELFIKSRIKELGLNWVKRYRGNLSRGQGALTYILRKLLPGEEVRTEEPIGNRLFLDIYCPKYKLAIEYHGRQHFEFVEHFHKDAEGFKESQIRDERKEQACKDLGIALVIFRYNDSLNEDIVYNRILEAIQNAPAAPEQIKHKKQFKGNPFYEKGKLVQRDRNRAAYREYKNRKRERRIRS